MDGKERAISACTFSSIGKGIKKDPQAYFIEGNSTLRYTPGQVMPIQEMSYEGQS